jgi:hypothetical protein
MAAAAEAALMREIPDVQQVPGEPRRRWFFSHEQDLIVWLGENGAPVGFQLAYGKYRNERALRWKAGKGFTHDAVDDGENAVVKEAALLVPDGYFDANEVLARFLELSVEMPPDVVAFVSAKLEAHPNYAEDA